MKAVKILFIALFALLVAMSANAQVSGVHTPEGWRATPSDDGTRVKLHYNGDQRVKSVNLRTHAFSVSDTKQVLFSRGNLQCRAVNSDEVHYQFAEHQYDVIGEENDKILTKRFPYTIDMFNWGGADNPLYYSEESSDFREFVEWGTKIGDGKTWRTLTQDEWAYLLGLGENDKRSGRSFYITVGGVHGMVLIPDDWQKTSDGWMEMPEGCTMEMAIIVNRDGEKHIDWRSNIYTLEQWAVMEANGAAFLPIAGVRSVYVEGPEGFGYGYWASNTAYYWSSTAGASYTYTDETGNEYISYSAHAIDFGPNCFDMYYYYDKHGIFTDIAASVRLVRDVPSGDIVTQNTDQTSAEYLKWSFPDLKCPLQVEAEYEGTVKVSEPSFTTATYHGEEQKPVFFVTIQDKDNNVTEIDPSQYTCEYLQDMTRVGHKIMNVKVPNNAGGNIREKNPLGSWVDIVRYCDINPIIVCIYGVTVADKVYDGTDKAIPIWADAYIDCVFEGDDVRIVPTHATANFVGENPGDGPKVGECKAIIYDNFSLTGEDAENYELFQPIHTVTNAKITPKEVEVKWSNTSLVYNGELQSPTVELIGVLPKDSYSVIISGAQVNVGNNYTVTVEGFDNPNYMFKDKASTTFSIAPRPLKITANRITKTYGDQDPSLTFTADGLVAPDQITGSQTRVKGENVGSYAISQGTLNVNNSNNYTVTYKGDSLAIIPKTVTLEWSDLEFEYDGKPHLPKVALKGILKGDKCNVTVVGEQTDAGYYTVTAKSLDNPNYKLPSNPTQRFTINPRKATITGVASANKVYDKSFYAKVVTSSAVLNGILPGDDVKIDIRKAVANFDDVNVGKDIVVTFAGFALDGKDKSNYILVAQPAPSAADITPKEIGIEWSNISLTYNGKPQQPSAKAIGVIDGDRCNIHVVGAQTNAGSYTATAESLDNRNYILPTECSKAFVINPQPLAITADNQSKIYGDQDPDFTYVAEGLIAPDVINGNLTRESGENVGTYAIMQGSLDAGANYQITYTGEKLTISPKIVGLEWSDLLFEYDTRSHQPTAVATGLLPGDECNVTVTGAQIEGGTYTATATKLDNRNYILPDENTQSFKIYYRDVAVLDSTQLVCDASSEYFCNGKARLSYIILSGEAVDYSLSFDNANIEPQSGAAPDDNVITFAIPKNLAVGKYSGTVVFYSSFRRESEPYRFEFEVVNIDGLIKKLYYNTLCADNHEHRYTSYQWRSNGADLSGETHQYLHLKDGLKGIYTVVVDGGGSYQKIESCPFREAEIVSKSASPSISVYPNPSVANQQLTIEIVDFDPASKYEIRINNNAGAVIKTISDAQQINTLTLRAGNYTGVLLTNGVKTGFKIIVK